MLERAAADSGCDDFAVRLNRWRPFSGLGPISLVLREEPDLRSALDVLIRYQAAYDGVIDLRLVEDGGLATVQVRLAFGRAVPLRQSLDATTATLMSTIRALMPPDWAAPGGLLLPPAPAELSAFSEVFGPVLRFDQEITGVVFSSRDLDVATVTAQPGARRYARQLLPALPRLRAATTADEVASGVELLLPVGRCSLASVSRRLGVQPRTLRRRLVAEGESFSEIVQATRVRLAAHYLVNERYPLTEISVRLGFATPARSPPGSASTSPAPPARGAPRTAPSPPRGVRPTGGVSSSRSTPPPPPSPVHRSGGDRSSRGWCSGCRSRCCCRTTCAGRCWPGSSRC